MSETQKNHTQNPNARRRVFEERGTDLRGKVLPLCRFVPFTDRTCGTPGPCTEAGIHIDPAYRDAIIRRAESVVNLAYPSLLATDYMMYARVGNRTVFEDKYFIRRENLLYLATAEYCEGGGRFLDAVINLVWMICEESSWVLPAHNLVRKGDSGALSYAVDGEYAVEVDYIDLFSAMTGADLAFVLYLLEDKLASVTDVLPRRIRFELERRIIRPFCDPANHPKMFWLGRGNAVNNWCPWVISNVLTAVALTEPDLSVRETAVSLAVYGLDTFTSMYLPDGGCDEGPSYWAVAGGALFNALEVLYDMTGGYLNVYDDPLIRRMGEYIVKVHVSGYKFLNFADSPIVQNADNPWAYEWGLRCRSDMLADFWQAWLKGGIAANPINHYMPYREYHQLALPVLDAIAYRPRRVGKLDNLMIAVTRECDRPDTGLYLAFKGGHNGEGHNHNDVGNVIVFDGATPVLLDVGRGDYTKRTFSAKRYEIWSMCSDYHNTAVINGRTQLPGAKYAASVAAYDGETGRMTLDLTRAYPDDTGIERYTRSAGITDGRVEIVERINLTGDGSFTLCFMTDCRPVIDAGRHVMTVHGVTVAFDARFTAQSEPASADDPETVGIPAAWGVDRMWRTTLTDDSVPGGTDITYVTTVGKQV